MDLASLRRGLEEFEPVWLSDGEEGTLRVLEKHGRAACDIATGHAAEAEEIVAQIRSVFSLASGRQPHVRLFIHVLYEAVFLADLGPALVALGDFLGPASNVAIAIHLDQPTGDWPAIGILVKYLREHLSRPQNVFVELIAPFEEFNESEMEKLFDLGVRVRFAAGWSRSCLPGQVLSVNTNALNGFSQYGFRTCIEWYVHEENIQEFERQISDLLIANCSSGFGLPLVSQNPYYKFESGFPLLPDAVQYTKLLARAYRQHPYYDEVLSPLNTLSMLVAHGAWNSEINLPTELHLILNERGDIGVFRHSAALARQWITFSDLAGKTADTLRDSFLAFSGKQVQREWISYCKECCWKNICGGLDDISSEVLTEKNLDTLCGHRKQFLRHFALLRVPDLAIGGNEQTAEP